MTTLVGTGDRLITAGGRTSLLKRGSVPLAVWAGGGAVTLAGEGLTISYAQLYEEQPWVGIAVNKLSRLISMLPLKVYRLDSQGDRERVREHALVDLLGKPWPRAGATKLKQKIAFPILLHGNSLLALDRPSSGAAPTGFVPLDWRFVTPHANEGGPVEFWETTQAGRPRFFAPENVLHTAWESSRGDIGVSPLKQLGVTIRGEDAAQRYGTAAFENAATPSGAVVLPADKRADADVRQSIRDEIQRIHGGVDNAFKVAVLGGGADWKSISHTAHEAELIEARKLNREEVAAAYDIPPPLVGILDHATYSNVAEMHRMLYMTVLGPWLTLIEETIQAQVVDSHPAFEGLFVEFDPSEQLKGDTRSRILALKDGIQTGLYTINEARKVENLPRIDDPLADRPLVPTNNLAPLGGEPASEEPIPPMLASHIARVGDRVQRKAAAGEEPWDRERFIRELKADIGQDLNGSAEAFCEGWADLLERGIAHADGDVESLRQFFAALS